MKGFHLSSASVTESIKPPDVSIDIGNKQPGLNKGGFSRIAKLAVARGVLEKKGSKDEPEKEKPK